MKLRLEPADQAFREEVRAFLREHLPADVARRSLLSLHPTNDRDRRWWNGVLGRKGWAAPHWPVEYGGTGWPHLWTMLFDYECRVAGAPELRWQGLRLVGPVIYTFATDAQKKRFLPGILSGETMWAQGFSEPGAGSDLASLKTSAVLDGDHYVLNGQKIWTTEGGESEWGFFLVRTDSTVKPQRGISMILLDMKSPGVTVRGIPTINGDTSTWEVFLDNVRVPRDQLVGEPGAGWTQAKFLLGNERTASADIDKAWNDLRRIHRMAAQEMRNGKPLLEDPAFTARLAEVELRVEALQWSVLRMLAHAPSEYDVAARASVLKIRGSSLQQQLGELAAEALGPSSLRVFRPAEALANAGSEADPLWPPYVPGVMNDHLYQRAVTIYGGAMEVQKNIIAKLAFGF